MAEIETRRVCVLSTGHLTPATCAMLTATPLAAWPVAGGPIAHGFYVYAHDEDGEGNIPPDLMACCTWARARRFDYIQFDCDAGTIEGLEVFDHEASAPAVAEVAPGEFERAILLGYTVGKSDAGYSVGFPDDGSHYTDPDPDGYFPSERAAWRCAEAHRLGYSVHPTHTTVSGAGDRWGYNAPNGQGAGAGYKSEVEAWTAAASRQERGNATPGQMPLGGAVWSAEREALVPARGRAGYDEALREITAGRAEGRALWVLLLDESDRDGRAIKPAPWEGQGEYQHVEFADGRSVFVRLPDLKALPVTPLKFGTAEAFEIGQDGDTWKWKATTAGACWSPPFDTRAEALADARADLAGAAGYSVRCEPEGQLPTPGGAIVPGTWTAIDPAGRAFSAEHETEAAAWAACAEHRAGSR